MSKPTIVSIDIEIEKLQEKKRQLLKAQEEKLKKQKEKEQLSTEILKQYAITDTANIWGIFPFIKRDESPQNFILKDKRYLPIEYNVIKSESFGNEERTILSKTKVSREYINKAKEIAELLGRKEHYNEPKFYMEHNNKGEIVEDNAVIMVIDNICFMFAPRVE